MYLVETTLSSYCQKFVQEVFDCTHFALTSVLLVKQHELSGLHAGCTWSKKFGGMNFVERADKSTRCVTSFAEVYAWLEIHLYEQENVSPGCRSLVDAEPSCDRTAKLCQASVGLSMRHCR